MAEHSCDLAIIGAGVAGLTAARTAAEHGLSVVVAEEVVPGGQVANVPDIDNFPGFPEGIAGYDLGPMLYDQADMAGAQFLSGRINSITPASGGYRLASATDSIDASAVLLAMGSRRRTLGLANEDALAGHGMSPCAYCETSNFAGQPVVVVGGGDSAFDQARLLATKSGRVTIVHQGVRPVARARAEARIAELANVDIIAGASVTDVLGDIRVEGVRIATASGPRNIEAVAIFVCTGLLPNSELVAGLVALDDEGRVIADGRFATSRAGLFVAGDLRSGATALLASAMGDGASAALVAARYCRMMDEPASRPRLAVGVGQ